MKIFEILNEFEVRMGYSGRDISVPDKTILWQYITYPRNAGLLVTLPDGATLLNGKNIGETLAPHDNSFTHKKQIAIFFDQLKLQPYQEKMNLSSRDFVEHMYEQNVRGRMLNENEEWVIYVWDYNSPEAKINKAVDTIFRQVKLSEGNFTLPNWSERRKTPATMSSRVRSKKHIATNPDEIGTPTEPIDPRVAITPEKIREYLRQDDEYREVDDFIQASAKARRDKAPGASMAGISKATGLRADRRAHLLKKLPFGPIREASRLNYGKRFGGGSSENPGTYKYDDTMPRLGRPPWGYGKNRPIPPGKRAVPKKKIAMNPSEIQPDPEEPESQGTLHPEDDDIYSVMKKVREPGGPKIRQRSKHNTHHIRKNDYDG